MQRIRSAAAKRRLIIVVGFIIGPFVTFQGQFGICVQDAQKCLFDSKILVQIIVNNLRFF
jgi:hypothetical protein